MIEARKNDTVSTERLLASQPIPAARSLSEFAVEQVGEDLVILDGETLQYHTLNGVARQIRDACDGVNTASQIASQVGLPVELVESTIAELGEAGLLQTPSSHWDATFTRRRASKLIAAGLVGAVGLPVIKSITAPDAASAATSSQCRTAERFGNKNCSPGQCSTGGTCQPLTDVSGTYCCV